MNPLYLAVVLTEADIIIYNVVCVHSYVYILLCNDGQTYIGCANNLKNRLHRHRKSYISSTKERLSVKLNAYFAIKDKNKAFAFEKYLKTGTGRAFSKKRLFL